MPASQPHARQRRASPAERGWCSSSEYAAAHGKPYSTVARWCAQGRVWDRTGAAVPVEGGDGSDYRIPLRAL